VLVGLGERKELLAAAWLASLRSPRTRRLSALSSFYRYCAACDLVGRNAIYAVAAWLA
jgi:hypothetical protein